MKLPRDVSARKLIRALSRLGYKAVRQTGSHVRMNWPGPPQDHLTIPNHNPVRVGTLGEILEDASRQTGMTREELIDRLDL